MTLAMILPIFRSRLIPQLTASTDAQRMYLLSFSTLDKNMKEKIGNSSCFSEAEARFHEQRRRLRRSAAEAVRRISLTAASTDGHELRLKKRSRKIVKSTPTRRAAAGVRSDRPFAWRARGD
jgi:hypothetical protein